jgi:hypothetical protein
MFTKEQLEMIGDVFENLPVQGTIKTLPDTLQKITAILIEVRNQVDEKENPSLHPDMYLPVWATRLVGHSQHPLGKSRLAGLDAQARKNLRCPDNRR